MPTRPTPMQRLLAPVTLGPVPSHRPELGPCELRGGGPEVLRPPSTVDGYATFWVDGERVYAHVFRFEEEVGPIPPGHILDHLCHAWWCPTAGPQDWHRRCIARRHLEPVTYAVNGRRGAGAAGVNSRKVQCDNEHPLTPDNIYWHPKRGTRHCRRCQSANYSRWAAKRFAGDGQLSLAVAF